MMKWIVGGLTAILLMVSATAQEPPCGNRDAVVRILESRYAEVMVGTGLAQNGYVFELYVSPQGTWTLLFMGTDGQACALTAGEAWEVIKAQKPSF